ncbi:MAG: hypothetical protein H6740_02845 [Alphaproteobacteria bacterium]|nr:hypothetical protein [Alphaproteobacteria bacterium]
MLMTPLLLLLPSAFAQDTATAPTDTPPRLETNGELRLIASQRPDFVIDDEGNTAGQGFALDNRLRLGGVARLKPVTLELEGDVLTGQLAGPTWNLGSVDERHRDEKGIIHPYSYQPRKAKVSGIFGPVKVDAGLMTSHWGLGLLANDGAHDPYFGRNDSGDIVLRVAGTTKPVKDKPLVVSLAADRGYYDDIGSWVPGGQAIWQGIAAVMWAPPEGLRVGSYLVYRHQQEADDFRATDIGATDLYFDWPMQAGGVDLRVAGEGAFIFGQTSRAQSINSPQGLGVLQGGATGLISAHVSEGRYGLVLRGGYASGDGDSYDGRTSDFTFDQNFDVGMVMFDEVQGALSAAAYERLLDPDHMGQPPDGADTLVAEGAFRRATFVQPILEAKPKDWVTLRLGAMTAWSTAPIADPFYSGRNGGTPTNQLNQKTSGYGMGFELDYGVTLEKAVTLGSDALVPGLRLQGGHYFASEDVGTGRADLFMATARVRW